MDAPKKAERNKIIMSFIILNQIFPSSCVEAFPFTSYIAVSAEVKKHTLLTGNAGRAARPYAILSSTNYQLEFPIQFFY